MAGGAGGAAQAGIGGLQILAAKQTADAIKRQSEFMARQEEFNAQLIQVQKQDIDKIATRDVDRRYQELRQVIGSQKATMAAQGIEVEGEIGAALEADERLFVQQDVQTIKNNAWREAMGLEIKSRELSAQATMTRLGGQEKARQTMVTGGLQGLSNIVSGGSSMYRG